MKDALNWITTLLTNLQIPFQITGGLAARAYGGTRPLKDIDIDIPEGEFEKIALEVSDYITFGPAHLKSDCWDLMLITLDYHGQSIDLGGAEQTKIYNKQTSQWVESKADFASVNLLYIDGILLPVVNRDELIAYKTILARPVDLIDIEQLSGNARGLL